MRSASCAPRGKWPNGLGMRCSARKNFLPDAKGEWLSEGERIRTTDCVGANTWRPILLLLGRVNSCRERAGLGMAKRPTWSLRGWFTNLTFTQYGYAFNDILELGPGSLLCHFA